MKPYRCPSQLKTGCCNPGICRRNKLLLKENLALPSKRARKPLHRLRFDVFAFICFPDPHSLRLKRPPGLSVFYLVIQLEHLGPLSWSLCCILRSIRLWEARCFSQRPQPGRDVQKELADRDVFLCYGASLMHAKPRPRATRLSSRERKGFGIFRLDHYGNSAGSLLWAPSRRQMRKQLANVLVPPFRVVPSCKVPSGTASGS